MNRRRWLALTGGGLLATYAFNRPPASKAPSALSVNDILGRVDLSNDFERVLNARTFSFPADHGPHETFRQEWWYFSGNLRSATARDFSFQFTIFRFGISPVRNLSVSAWRAHDVYLAHFAVCDIHNGQFQHYERMHRASLDLAGASINGAKIWLKDWQIAAGPVPDSWRISAASAETSLSLELTPQKKIIAHGKNGLSIKGNAPGNASYYYSQSRLAARGKIRNGTNLEAVSGTAWLDREWGTTALDTAQVGWDWFGLQFSNQYELMLYALRRRDHSIDAHSAGTWIKPNGISENISAQEFSIEVLTHWHSPSTAIFYPSSWRIRIPKLGLVIDIAPRVAAQEWTGLIRYWEGAVACRGESSVGALAGLGYAELTGYA